MSAPVGHLAVEYRIKFYTPWCVSAHDEVDEGLRLLDYLRETDLMTEVEHLLEEGTPDRVAVYIQEVMV